MMLQAMDYIVHVGAVLSHLMPDGSERPIGFVSLSENNFSQIEKEALAP